MFFSVLEKDKDYDWVKAIRTRIANRFPLLLFEIFLIVYAIWIALGVIRYFNSISLDNDSIGSIFIFPIPAILAFSCMIATLTILTTMFSSWLLYPQPQTDPSKRFDNSNSAISRFLSSVKLSFIAEIWRQVAYFMFCITIPLTVIGLYLLHTQPWSYICFCTIESLPILYYILILQIAYIVFNLVMRRIYARIGKLNRWRGSNSGGLRTPARQPLTPNSPRPLCYFQKFALQYIIYKLTDGVSVDIEH